MEKLIIVGARKDGHAGAVIDQIIEQKEYSIVGLFDDNRALHGTYILGLPVIGGIHAIYDGKINFEYAFVCIGDNKKREYCIKLMRKKNIKLINVIHRTAYLPTSVRMGNGIFIGPHVAIIHHTSIGDGVIINTAATIDHDNIIGDFANISPGCHTSGRVHIKKGAFLGTGVSIIPDITIGEYAIVGAGSVVIRNVNAKATVAGVPCKEIDSRNPRIPI